MYIFRQTVIEIGKTFLASILCSIVFAFMIYRDTALPYVFVCLVLNGSAFFLFLYIFYRNMTKLFEKSFTASEYLVPALCSVAAYILVTVPLYTKRFMFYMWFFMPTRFIEPWLNSRFAYLSIIVAYFAMLIVVAVAPMLDYRRK